MITVLPSKNEDEIKALFESEAVLYNEKSGCVIARLDDEMLGYCLYYLDDKSITVLALSPSDDLFLADGILRSALHVASERFITDARYEGDGEVYKKLGFIKNTQKKTLDIDKLFKGCKCE